MANTEKLGSQWRGKAWGDGEPIPRVALPDASLAEAEAALVYGWNGSAFQKVTVDPTTGGLLVSSAPNSAGTTSFATIVASTSGATTVVPLVSTKKIRVISLALVANAAVNVKFQSHLSPTDVSGLFYLAANGGFVLPASQYGWFETVAGEALDINLSGAIAVGGALVYTTI